MISRHVCQVRLSLPVASHFSHCTASAEVSSGSWAFSPDAHPLGEAATTNLRVDTHPTPTTHPSGMKRTSGLGIFKDAESY